MDEKTKAENAAKEAAAKEAAEKAAKEAAAAPGAGDATKKPGDSDGGGDGNPNHPDAAQDKALFQKLIKDHLGDSYSDDEEAVGAAKQAYESYKEMGYKEDEAMKCAGHAMKLAAHHAKKQQEAGAGAGAADGAADKSKTDAPKTDETTPPKKEGEPKETVAPKEADKDALIMKLTAENAVFKSRDARNQIGTHIESVCRESKLSNSITKKFKESDAVKSAKSTGDIDRLFKIFKEGAEGVLAERAQDHSDLFAISPEKHTFVESDKSGESGKIGGFEDCVQ